MTKIRLRSTLRDPDRWQGQDHQIGQGLVEVLIDQHRKSVYAPELWLFYSEHIEMLNFLGPISRRLLAGLCNQDNVCFAAMIGPVQFRNQRLLHTYIEWPDNRWWLWSQGFPNSGSELSGAIDIRSAIHRDSKSIPVGGWFAMGRRDRVKIQLRHNDTHHLN